MVSWPHEEDPPVSRPVAVALIVLVVAGSMLAVSLFVFEFDGDDGGPPAVRWELTADDPPVLSHNGGDPVACNRVFVVGELGSNRSLCAYFETDRIEEGDTASLMSIGNRSGSISLEWYDTELNQRYIIETWPDISVDASG